MIIRVFMTETCNYTADFDVAAFAELVGCEPTEEAVLAILADEDLRSGDYGVENADQLLDRTLEHFDACTDRSWAFEAMDEAKTKEGR